MSKKTKTVRHGDKCAFVRKLPPSMSAREVQYRAAKGGLFMSVPYIHNIRSFALKQSRKLEKPSLFKGRTKAFKEKAFRQLVVEFGPARARKLLDIIEGSLIREG